MCVENAYAYVRACVRACVCRGRGGGGKGGEYAYVRAFVSLFPLQSVGFIDQIAASFGCRQTSLQHYWQFVFNPKDSRLEIFVLVLHCMAFAKTPNRLELAVN